jgi:hypothetical protein
METVDGIALSRFLPRDSDRDADIAFQFPLVMRREACRRVCLAGDHRKPSEFRAQKPGRIRKIAAKKSKRKNKQKSVLITKKRLA